MSVLNLLRQGHNYAEERDLHVLLCVCGRGVWRLFSMDPIPYGVLSGNWTDHSRELVEQADGIDVRGGRGGAVGIGAET